MNIKAKLTKNGQYRVDIANDGDDAMAMTSKGFKVVIKRKKHIGPITATDHIPINNLDPDSKLTLIHKRLGHVSNKTCELIFPGNKYDNLNSNSII